MSGATEKAKRIEVENALVIARRTLEKIAYGHSHNPQIDASTALDEMHTVSRKAPLQGLVGHANR